MIRGVSAVLGAVAFCASSSSVAQVQPAVATTAPQTVVTTAPQALVVQKAQIGNSLPANSEVWVSLNSLVSSKKMEGKKTKVGDKFDVTVSRDVMMGDYIVIPRGTPGHGQIGYRTGKGAFGKSAKMEFDLVDVKVGDRFIPVSGHYRVEGEGNTGAAIGAAVAVGVFGAFVTGKSATAAQGSEWKAYTKEPILLAVAPASVATPLVAANAGNTIQPTPTTTAPVQGPTTVSATVVKN